MCTICWITVLTWVQLWLEKKFGLLLLDVRATAEEGTLMHWAASSSWTFSRYTESSCVKGSGLFDFHPTVLVNLITSSKERVLQIIRRKRLTFGMSPAGYLHILYLGQHTQHPKGRFIRTPFVASDSVITQTMLKICRSWSSFVPENSRSVSGLEELWVLDTFLLVSLYLFLSFMLSQYSMNCGTG